jgi:hypothetical protein
MLNIGPLGGEGVPYHVIVFYSIAEKKLRTIRSGKLERIIEGDNLL